MSTEMIHLTKKAFADNSVSEVQLNAVDSSKVAENLLKVINILEGVL